MEKYDILKKFRKKIKDLNSLEEIIEYYEQIKNKTNNSIELILIESFINPLLFKKKINTKDFMIYMDIIKNVKYREDIQDLVYNLLKITEDIVQINILNKLLEKKPYEYNCFNKKNEKILIYVTKKCPHCNNECTYDIDEDYVVCGYTQKGFDWIGCGNDWCFQCNKKLCKNWNIHSLFNIKNRYHNKKCCKFYSYISNDNYPDDFCFCNKNRHAKR